jgi:hypothetical protein
MHIEWTPHQDDGRLRLQTASDADVQRVQEMQYFLKGPGDVITTVEMLSQRLQWGSIKGAALESLLRVMNKVYLPTFLSNATWPESTSGRCCEQLAYHTALTMSAYIARASSLSGTVYTPPHLTLSTTHARR